MRSNRGRLDTPFRSERSAVLSRRGMVATSVPLAADAGAEQLGAAGEVTRLPRALGEIRLKFYRDGLGLRRTQACLGQDP